MEQEKIKTTHDSHCEPKTVGMYEALYNRTKSANHIGRTVTSFHNASDIFCFDPFQICLTKLEFLIILLA